MSPENISAIDVGVDVKKDRLHELFGAVTNIRDDVVKFLRPGANTARALALASIILASGCSDKDKPSQSVNAEQEGQNIEIASNQENPISVVPSQSSAKPNPKVYDLEEIENYSAKAENDERQRVDRLVYSGKEKIELSGQGVLATDLADFALSYLAEEQGMWQLVKIAKSKINGLYYVKLVENSANSNDNVFTAVIANRSDGQGLELLTGTNQIPELSDVYRLLVGRLNLDVSDMLSEEEFKREFPL